MNDQPELEFFCCSFIQLPSLFAVAALMVLQATCYRAGLTGRRHCAHCCLPAFNTSSGSVALDVAAVKAGNPGRKCKTANGSDVLGMPESFEWEDDPVPMPTPQLPDATTSLESMSA